MDAKNQLFIVSPYLQISSRFYERLIEASHNGISTKFVFRENQLKPFEKEKLTSLKNVSLYYSHNLHAKCYFNETKMVITSMNLFEQSEKNREMGILVTRKDDEYLFTQAAIEALSIIKFSTIDSQKLRKYSYDNKGPNLIAFKNNLGFCIRCQTRIDFNPDKPLCKNCYKTWAQFSNYDYLEKACHCCGQSDFITYNYPQCSECYYEFRAELKK